MSSRTLAAAVALLGASSCLAWLPAPTPMKSVRDVLPEPARAKCLLVMLPGVGEGMEGFGDHGFVNALRARGISADVAAANATLGYYGRGTLPVRLGEDVVDPMLTHEYARVFVLGISMGGMGTLWYAHEHPALVTDLILMSPYLGSSSLVAEIRKSGGLAKWKAPPRVEHVTDSNYQTEIWRWLQADLAGTEKGPRIFLGYGSKDRGVPDLDTLAAALPASNVLHAPGPHDWPTWSNLWQQYLDQGELTRACGTR